MTPEQLKASILQYAIQGKLVEQRPEEGTGEELYQQIQEDKQRLIKEGKIKKEKPLPDIKDDEIPFDIRDSWKWVRWGQLSFSIQYGYNAPAKKSGKIKMVRISDIQNGRVIWETVPFCDIKEEEITTYLLAKNDILFARTGGTVGKSYIVKEISEDAIYAGYLIRTKYSDMLCPEYLYYFMQTQLYWEQLREGTISTAQPNCNGQRLSKMILPLPPLEEQKRIVAKIEELLPHVERYAVAYEKLEQLNAKFPEQIKKSILQYAIQGKLVEQRPEEGTAKELYKKIQEEKQKLAKVGESFRNKKYAMITEEDKVYDIPETWIWMRLNDIVFNHGQKTPDKPFAYIDIGSIDNKKQQLNDEESIIEASKAPSRARKIVRDGDILYSTVRPYLHNMCIVDNRFTCNPIASTGFAVLACCNIVYNKYLFYYLLSPWFDAYANDTSNSKGVAYPAINDDKLYKAIVPIPPLGEQKRIVAKIEKLLLHCTRLKK
jgi:hypothetical protein